MSQTKKESLAEATMNVMIGFLITMTASFVVYPMFGVIMSHWTNVWVTITFTVISLIRGYVIRRWFNKKDHTIVYKDPTNQIFK
jgi:membrane protein implicated in regulation of membrane protease activity